MGTRTARIGALLLTGAVFAAGSFLCVRFAAAQDPGSAALPTIEACASDPKVLGLERIVEIDPADGPVFGGSHGYNNFLNDKEVVLTFDDGPLRPYTRPVLKALAAHCTKATFFMVGRMAAADPGLVKEIMASGHTVASHTWSHQNLKALQFFKARSEFELGLSAVTKAAGKPIAPFFRFPYLSDNRMILNYVRSRQTATFFIDIDSKDFQTRNSDLVYQRVMHELMRARKGIILLHDIQPSTAGMIKRLLDTLHDKGFKIVHMVPKGSAATLAEFDGSAQKSIKTKSDALRDKPLADRSMVWTMTPEDQVGGEKPTQAVPTPANAAPSSQQKSTSISTGSTSPSASPGYANQEQLPWLKNEAAPATKARSPSARKQVRRQPDELPWQMQVFQ